MRNACARKELFASVNACYFFLEAPKKVVPSMTRSRRAIVISLDAIDVVSIFPFSMENVDFFRVCVHHVLGYAYV